MFCMCRYLLFVDKLVSLPTLKTLPKYVYAFQIDEIYEFVKDSLRFIFQIVILDEANVGAALPNDIKAFFPASSSFLVSPNKVNSTVCILTTLVM